MSKDDNTDGKGILPSAFLLAAVAVVLLAGMFLRTGAPRNLPPKDDAASPAPSLPLGSTITPELTTPAAVETETRTEPEAEAAPEAAPEPVLVPANHPLLVRLAERAEADSQRLGKARGRWTAQLLVACKPETVDRLLGIAHGSSALYVLPAQVKNDPCFRVCFGAYATSKQAAVATDLPKALRGKEKLSPVEIAKVLP